MVYIVAAEWGPMPVSPGLRSRRTRPFAMSSVFARPWLFPVPAMRLLVTSPIFVFFVAAMSAFFFPAIALWALVFFVACGGCILGT